MEIWEPKPPGTHLATPGLLRDCFTFTFTLLIQYVLALRVSKERPFFVKLTITYLVTTFFTFIRT